MHFTNFLVPTTIIASILVLLGLGPVTWLLIRANRVGEAAMLARWADKSAVQIIASRRVIFFPGCGFGGHRAPYGFRVTIRTRESQQYTGLLTFAWNRMQVRQGLFTPDTPPIDSNQLPDPTSPSVTPAAGAAGAPSVAADH